MHLTAFEVAPTEHWSLSPAEISRDWMKATPNAFAERCLPLLMANQAGWVIGCPADLAVLWDGTPSYQTGISIQCATPDVNVNHIVTSHFGSGIITFTIPFLFRTPPGIGLLVRGAPNHFKEYCWPLEGFVETDWAIATFTMNWKITTPRRLVTFQKGEPICFVQPHDLSLIEQMSPKRLPIHSDPELLQQFNAWRVSRSNFNSRDDRGSEWQKHYFKGENANGVRHPTHRTKCSVKPFVDDTQKPKRL
jgi:hypothetical protein